MNGIIPRHCYCWFSLLWLTACAAPAAKQPSVIDAAYLPDLNVVKREQWGWTPTNETHPGHSISHITVHHGGVHFPDDKDPVKHLVALQSWSRRDKQWVDIPYHYMIDRQGVTYEARPLDLPGDTNTEYDPAGHALISVMGNYDEQHLIGAQLDALVSLIAYLVGRYDLDPEVIRGHRDYAETTCPGTHLYQYLDDGSIQARVEEFLK
jgi:hypothetical protein